MAADTKQRRRRRGRSANAPIGSDLERRGMPEFLTYDSLPAELCQSLRSMVNRHELRTGGPLPSAMTFTSAMGGEGTTMVSRSLATLLAHEAGKFVCWVDCTWLANPVGESTTASSGNEGLIEMLRDHSKILSAFRSAPELPQLTSLSPGPVPNEKRHMIVRSPEFEQLMAILVEEFDHVIFDTPPLLGAGDGLSLLRRSDGYVLVVKQRSTSESQVRKAIELAAPTPNLGVVLTEYESKTPEFIRRLLGD